MSDPTTPVDPERDKSPRRAMCAAVLSLEAIAVGLSTPVMIGISEVRPGVALPLAWAWRSCACWSPGCCVASRRT